MVIIQDLHTKLVYFLTKPYSSIIYNVSHNENKNNVLYNITVRTSNEYTNKMKSKCMLQHFKIRTLNNILLKTIKLTLNQLYSAEVLSRFTFIRNAKNKY